MRWLNRTCWHHCFLCFTPRSPTTHQWRMSLKAKRSEREVTPSKRDQKEGGWSSRPAAPHYKKTFTPRQPICQQVPKPPHKTAQLRRNKPTSDAAKTRCQGKWFHQVQLIKHRFTDTSQGGRVCSHWQHSPLECVDHRHWPLHLFTPSQEL